VSGHSGFWGGAGQASGRTGDWPRGDGWGPVDHTHHTPLTPHTPKIQQTPQTPQIHHTPRTPLIPRTSHTPHTPDSPAGEWRQRCVWASSVQHQGVFPPSPITVSHHRLPSPSPITVSHHCLPSPSPITRRCSLPTRLFPDGISIHTRNVLVAAGV